MESSRQLGLIVALLSASAVQSTTLGARAQLDQSQAPVNIVALALPRPVPVRSPAALIEDLVQVATHRQDSYLQSQAKDRATGKESIKASSKTTYQHLIPDVVNINYRPARAAAMIYMGHGSEDNAAKQLDEAKFKDQITVLVTSILLDLATGLGERPANKELGDSTIQASMEKLSNLVGPQEANWAFERLEKFSQSVRPPVQELDHCAEEQAPDARGGESAKPLSSLKIPPKFSLAWDVSGQEVLASQIATRAIARDQIVRNLKAQLGVHENPPNPLEKSLSLLAMIPEVVATAALVGDQILEMSNGGTREKRLTDVMSLGLQLDSREATLTRQSYLAATSLNAGTMNGNQVLSQFARALALQLSGQ